MTTTGLYPLASPNAIAFLLAHLAPLGPCGPVRHENDPLPFRVVDRIGGADDLNLFCDKAVLSVHTFAGTRNDVINEAETTHRRIMLFDIEVVDVPMIGGGVANADYLNVHQHPIITDYQSDHVFRTKAVYELHISFDFV